MTPQSTANTAAGSGPAWERLEDQRGWYDRKSASNKRIFMRTTVLKLLAAAAIPERGLREHNGAALLLGLRLADIQHDRVDAGSGLPEGGDDLGHILVRTDGRDLDSAQPWAPHFENATRYERTPDS
jgi:hypothetical protein